MLPVAVLGLVQEVWVDNLTWNDSDLRETWERAIHYHKYAHLTEAYRSPENRLSQCHISQPSPGISSKLQEPTVFLSVGRLREGVRSSTTSELSVIQILLYSWESASSLWTVGIFEGWHLPKATDLDTYCKKEFVFLTIINRTNKGHSYIDPTVK